MSTRDTAMRIGPALLTVILGCLPGEATCEALPPKEPPGEDADLVVSFGVEDDFNALYAWRGLALSNGPVMQPSAWVSAFGTTLELWTSMYLTDMDRPGRFDEIDVTLGYEAQVADLVIAPRLLSYFYPTGEPSDQTMELALDLSYALGPFELRTSHAVDLVQYLGSYWGELGILMEHEMAPGLSISLSGGVGWATRKFNAVNVGVRRAAINALLFGVELVYYPVDVLYLRLHYELSGILDPVLGDAVGSPVLVNLGLAAGFEY